MLDGARDADCDVEIRRDDLAGLADLQVVRGIAGIDRGARGADGGIELLREGHQQRVEFLLAAESAATGDDDLGRAELGAIGLLRLFGDDARQRGSPKPARDDLDAVERRRREGRGADGDDLLASDDCTVSIALPA